MPEEVSFAELIHRVRAGDQAAATELVRRYEPAIRRTIRIKMRDSRLRRHFDSVDICQSVLTSFFVRAALGEYDLDQPEQLVKLLTAMARNKLVNQVHHQQAGRRDHRRVEAGGAADRDMPGHDATPSQVVAGQELLQRFLEQLTTEERQLADLRATGVPWALIGAQLGGNPDALRIKLGRAVDRVGRQLGLDDFCDK